MIETYLFIHHCLTNTENSWRDSLEEFKFLMPTKKIRSIIIYLLKSLSSKRFRAV